jgi:hypothetical protein
MTTILFFISMVFAGEINIYAETMKVYRDGTEIINYISNEIPFVYASQHVAMAQQKSQYGWEQIEDANNVNVWNEKTIRYKHKGCNYEMDGLGCSVRNRHYYLRTFVELREDEALITQQLFNKNAKVISTSSFSNKKIIIWIKQQEVTVIQQQGLMGSTTVTHKPKEELPLKWEIPWRIFSNDFRQLSLKLWSGIKLQ